MKKYLYVDTENTGLSFIDLVSRMGKSWKVTIFYSVKSPKLSFQEMDLLSGSRCSCRFVQCRNGRPNAMDFCIMADLGVNVERHPRAMHLIMSRDKGYLSGIELLREKGYYVGEIVLDETSRSVSWVSSAESAKPYGRIRDYFDSLYALEQIPREGLAPAEIPADGSGAGSAVPLLSGPAPARRRRRGGRRAAEEDAADTGGVTESILEKKLIGILIDRFDAVGVDRQKKLMGQVMKRGLKNSFQTGILHFDAFLPYLRKFAAFRGDDEMVRCLLSLLGGIDGLLITGAEEFYGASPDCPDEVPEDVREEEDPEELTEEEGADPDPEDEENDTEN